jgi:capsular polysaccharide biosynthesis protein
MKFHFTSDLTNKLCRQLLGEKRLSDVASQAHEIEPACDVQRVPALHNPQELQRITGVGDGTTLEMELARIGPGVTHHQATMAYELRDAILMDGALYLPRFKHGISHREKLVSGLGTAAVIDDAGVLAQSWLGSRYFGHWLTDDVPLAWMAQHLGKAVGVQRPLTTSQQAYGELFGVRHLGTLPSLAHVGKITVLADAYYNHSKVQRWRSMRQIAAQHSTGGGPRFKGVMLLRGATGEARKLVNEAQLADRLRSLGFYVVDPASVSLDAFLAQAAGADVVVGVEGSQLANGMVCLKEGGSMLVLQPPFRFNNIYKDICDALQNPYAFVVGEARPGGFAIDPDVVEVMLERLMATGPSVGRNFRQ